MKGTTMIALSRTLNRAVSWGNNLDEVSGRISQGTNEKALR